jgi:hypothetical protein
MVMHRLINIIHRNISTKRVFWMLYSGKLSGSVFGPVSVVRALVGAKNSLTLVSIAAQIGSK